MLPFQTHTPHHFAPPHNAVFSNLKAAFAMNSVRWICFRRWHHPKKTNDKTKKNPPELFFANPSTLTATYYSATLGTVALPLHTAILTTHPSYSASHPPHIRLLKGTLEQQLSPLSLSDPPPFRPPLQDMTTNNTSFCLPFLWLHTAHSSLAAQHIVRTPCPTPANRSADARRWLVSRKKIVFFYLFSRQR